MLKLEGIGMLKRTRRTLMLHEVAGVNTGEAPMVEFSMMEEGPMDDLGMPRLKVSWTTRVVKGSRIVDEVGEGDVEVAKVEEVEVVGSSIHTAVAVVHGKPMPTIPKIWK